ncbi:hypothetical protein ZIOFF_022866 [Zingiber officinale]|uniref:Uncharacterized protein n=1 Tax=Zingiber officinale TaxID=94328 RepID=A0A8J5H3I5_ZINOF|nr:hypothetical protein ZIOFF_022866 [Zingiber officinale]
MKVAVTEIEFLGAIIGNCRIKLQPHVISKIADFKDNELKTTKEAISATDPIESPSTGFAKPSDYQGSTPSISTIIKQNNTQIQLLVQISETLKEIQASLQKQNPTAFPSDLITKLQNLTLSKPKEKPGKLRLFNAQQAVRPVGQALIGGTSTRHTLEQQIEPETQLQLSMQERASIVPAEVLYHSRRDDAHHRVYVHRSEEAMLVTDNHQADRSFIQEESFNQLRRSGMQYIHLGVLQVRIQILHRQREGTMALVVFRDNRWQGDQAILATMEVDLTQGSQMIYVIPEIMMTIGDFYRNIQISILTRGYEAWQNSEANLLITRGLVGRLSNTPNVGFAYEVQGVVDYLTSHGVKALPGRSFSTHRLQGLNWTINPTQITIPMQPSEVNSQTMLDGRISLSFNNYVATQEAEPPKYNDRDEEILAVIIETHPGVFTYYDGTESEYFENYGDSDNVYDKGKQIAEQEENYSRYSLNTEPHILVNRMFPQAVLPKRKTEGSAGLDITASHDAIIEPYGRELVHTGLRIENPIRILWPYSIPFQFCMETWNRSRSWSN